MYIQACKTEKFTKKIKERKKKKLMPTRDHCCTLLLHSTTHSWFKLVMNTLIASMEIGFQITISKSEVQMTSNFFTWSKIGQM